jgi:retinol dehydrogenase 12
MMPAPGDQDGRTFMVTGATGGIGMVTARELATRGATVFITARSAAKGQRALEQLTADSGSDRLHLLELELGDLGSVRACANAFAHSGEPLHGLINNAGLAGQRGITASGFELAFGTNHVGPFLLTSLLLDRLRESAPARIVNVSSAAHYRARGIDFEQVRQPTRTRTGLPEYGVSKLANVLHAQELARRLADDGVTTYSLHPGVIASDVWRSIPWPIRPLIKLRMRSPQDGARTSVYCATSAEVAAQTGLYYEDCQEKTPGDAATPELAAELWKHSEAWVATAVA